MNAGRILWVVGAYLAGTFPSTFIVARATRARGLVAASGRRAGETDPHILMQRHLGIGWTVLAATLDVLKGFLVVVAARRWGGLPPSWLALASVAAVLGHSFPPYAWEMAGRGVATAAGVYLALLPVEMVVAGVTIVIGRLLMATGAAATLGLASVPVLAALQGQPGEFVAMAAAIFAIILIRRLEGIGEVIRSGIRPGRAIWYRCVFDSSGPPGRAISPGRAGEDVPEA